MGNGDQMRNGNCYHHAEMGDSNPQLTSSTLMISLSARVRAAKASSIHKNVVRTVPLQRGKRKIAAFGYTPAPGFAMASGNFHGSLSFNSGLTTMWHPYLNHGYFCLVVQLVLSPNCGLGAFILCVAC
jgi:hypothetical protein